MIKVSKVVVHEAEEPDSVAHLFDPELLESENSA